MNRNKIIPVIVRLLSALALVVLLVAPVVAQPVGEIGPTEKSEQDSLRQARRAAAKAVEEARSSTGWLILDGKLIPGPYDIVLEDDCIKINGLPYMAPKLPEPKGDVPQNIKDQHNASSGILKTFHQAVPIVGVDSARALALEYALSQAVIDTAYFTHSYRLEILPKGESWPGFIWLQPLLEPPQPYEEIRKECLQRAASDLRGWLSHGCLVITKSTGGTVKSFGPPRAKEILIELERIATTISDLQERIEAVKEVIGYDVMVEVIAREFMQD